MMRPCSSIKRWTRPGREQGGIFINLIVLLFFVLFCTGVYLVRHPLMRWAANWWVVEDSFEKADCIVVLSDDNFFADRASRAAELYRQGKGPVVVASGRRLRPNAGISELMEHDLIERGVPKDKILRAPHDADSTREEAEALLRLTRLKKWRSLIVVTSNYHTRRARYTFRKIFPQAVEVYVASARDGDFDPDQWWMKRQSVKKLTREWLAMIVAVWELRGQVETKSVPQSVVQGKEFHPQLVV
jgi:uncharacterized SAM-binding protein YcdF (DUF218 family)